MNKVPKGCDQQGRFPEAAEAATEVGQEEPNFYSKELMLEEAAKFAVAVVIVGAAVVLAAFLAGRFL